MSRARTVWTPKADAILDYMWTSGATKQQLKAAFPNQSSCSIYLRVRRLNLPYRYLKIEPSEKAKRKAEGIRASK